jgi:O-antigen/teichoic acid export membrane protein
LQQLPATIVTDVVGRVAFPHFSSMQDDPRRLKSELRRLSRVVAALHFPVMAGLAATAAVLIPVLLTDKWRECVPILQVLCFAGLLYPLNALHVSAINAQGQAAVVLRLELVKKGFLVAMLLTTFRFGVLAMAWGMVAHYVACSLLNLWWNWRSLGYSLGEWLSDIVPILLVACVPALVALLLQSYAGAAGPVLLALQVLAGIAVYCVLALLLRGGIYSDAWGAVRTFSGRRPLPFPPGTAP